MPRLRPRFFGRLKAVLIAVGIVVAGVPGATPVGAGGSTPDVVQVEVGNSFACARKGDLSVWCWGRNDHRQLNDGTLNQRRTPVRSRVTLAEDIAVGDNHACALRTNDTVWCWGRNGSAELGDGTTLPRTGKVRVLLPEADWVDISAGGGTTCARLVTRYTYCWGRDFAGQVGDGPNPGAPPATNVATPALILTADQVSPGDDHTCAVDWGGFTKCWGGNDAWQLGDNTTTTRPSPERVDMGGVLEDVRYVDTGDRFTCARKVDYTVWCWGNNSKGVLGRGTSSPVGTTIAEIVGLDDVRQLSLNGDHVCATDAARRAYCWGNNNTHQLGVVNYDDTPERRRRPTRVPNLSSDVVEIDVGVSTSADPLQQGGFTCARKLDRTVWCWGRNDRGQLGDGTVTDRRRPELVQFP